MQKHAHITLALVASAAFGSVAMADTAGFSSFNPAASGDGAGSAVLDILANSYGGSWGVSDGSFGLRSGLDLRSSNGIVARRVADFYTDSNGGVVQGGALHIGTSNWNDGASSDQLWQDGTVHSLARARFAGNQQNLFSQNVADSSFRRILSVTNASGFDPATSFAQPQPDIFPHGAFRWVLATGESGGQPAGSQKTSDSQGFDQLVTYQLFNADGSAVSGSRSWFMFFEDLTPGDNDHNDLAVQINAVAVPLPSAACAGLGMLAMIGAGSRRRRVG